MVGGGGGSQALTSGVSDVMADSFSGKLKGLACLLPKMSEFGFNCLNRHLSVLHIIVRLTLDLILHLLSCSQYLYKSSVSAANRERIEHRSPS